jgi:tetratricopeptide (TPR) repeat protein
MAAAASVAMLFMLLVEAAAAADILAEKKDCINDKASPELRINVCTSLIQSGNLPKKKLSIAFMSRGNAYYLTGQFNRAIKNYDQAIKVYPDLPLAHRNRGLSYAKLGEYNRAIRDLDKAISLAPNDAGAYDNRGYTYTKMGQHTQAIEDYFRAIKLNPDSPNHRFNLGKAYFDTGEYDLAIESYGQAIKLNPNRTEFYNNRATTYAAIGQYDRAIQDHDKAIMFVTSSKHAQSFFSRGETLLKMGLYDRAVLDYEQSIRLNPNHASAYASLAWVLSTASDASIRDGVKAVRMALKAAEFNNTPGNQSLIAVAYAEAGIFDKAVNEQQQALNRLIEKKGNGDVVQYRALLDLFKRKQPYRQKNNSNGSN